MKRKAGSVRDGAGCPVLSLDGTWLIAMDPKNIGREQGWPRKPPAAGTRETRVPSVIQETFAATHGVAWYWRRFTVPVHPLARGRYLLRFHAVDYLAEVWVNGLSVGGHEGGETPFTLDVTDAVKKGTNSLAVRVLNPAAEPIDGMTLKQTPHRNKAIPFTPGSDANHGGIFLPVELLLVPAVRILDVHTVPDWRTGRVHVTVTVLNTLGSARSATVGVRVAPAQGGETLVLEQTSGSLPPGQSSVAVRLRVPDHRLWNLEDPCLYRITVTLTQGRDTDERSLRIGFRDFRVVRGFFRLNGKRILLKSTHTGNCTPGSLVIPPASAPSSWSCSISSWHDTYLLSCYQCPCTSAPASLLRLPSRYFLMASPTVRFAAR